MIELFAEKYANKNFIYFFKGDSNNILILEKEYNHLLGKYGCGVDNVSNK